MRHEADIDLKRQILGVQITHLTDRAVPASLDVMLALVTGVHKAVLALVVQLYQHAHCAPFTPSQRAELPVLVPGQSQKGITAIHEVTAQHRVRVYDGWQGVDDRPGVKVDDKKHLVQKKKHNSLLLQPKGL